MSLLQYCSVLLLGVGFGRVRQSESAGICRVDDLMAVVWSYKKPTLTVQEKVIYRPQSLSWHVKTGSWDSTKAERERTRRQNNVKLKLLMTESLVCQDSLHVCIPPLGRFVFLTFCAA